MNINKHILKFRNYISNEVELSESEIDDLMEFSYIKNFKKDEILIKQSNHAQLFISFYQVQLNILF